MKTSGHLKHHLVHRLKYNTSGLLLLQIKIGIQEPKNIKITVSMRTFTI